LDMNVRPVIMVLTPRMPYPPIGGDRLRMYKACEAMSEHFDILLVTLCESREELELDLPARIFKKVHKIYLSPWRSKLQVLIALFGGKSLQEAYFWSKEFKECVSKHRHQGRVLLTFLVRMTQYIEGFSDQPRIVDMIDAMSMIYDRTAKTSNWRSLKYWLYRIEKKRTLKLERSTLSINDKVILISEIDRSWLADSGISTYNVVIANNGVDLDRPTVNYDGNSKSIIFIGNMATLQNQDSCRYFIAEVLPLVRRQLDVTFKIIGPCSRSVRARFEAYTGVEVKGTLVNMSDALQDVICGVCFMRIAGGVQNKILDYMSYGIPAVVNAVALEGLQAIPARDVVLENDPVLQAEAIIKLSASKAYWSSIGMGGRKYVEAHHSWRSKMMPFVEIISRLIHDRQRAGL
jgi:glycosyltransferase involved in cell wall biosynthesis